MSNYSKRQVGRAVRNGIVIPALFRAVKLGGSLAEERTNRLEISAGYLLTLPSDFH
jgi:hypothetical protein